MVGTYACAGFCTMPGKSCQPTRGAMKKTVASLIAACLMVSVAAAQSGATSKSSTKSGGKGTSSTAPKLDRAHLEKIWAAWQTLDPANAAPYYSKDPSNVYFDIAPLKYVGWDAYAKGAKQLLSDFKAVKFTLGNDARITPLSSEYSLVTATWHADITHQNNAHEAMDGRWTALFKNEGGQWLDVHEQVSVPLAAPEPAVKPAPKKQ